MWRILFLLLMLVAAVPAQAQMANLTKAKYVAVLKVVASHKMKDEDIVGDLERLNESERFKKDLNKIINKLDNSKPNDANNRKVMRILEQAGKEIYNEFK